MIETEKSLSEKVNREVKESSFIYLNRDRKLSNRDRIREKRWIGDVSSAKETRILHRLNRCPAISEEDSEAGGKTTR